MKLDIGGGELKLACFRDDGQDHHLEEWHILDSYNLNQDMTIEGEVDNIPLADNSVEEIWCSHVLEHVWPQKIEQTLNEWYRILAVGGRMRLIVPNLPEILKNWLNEPDDSPAKFGWYLNTIFGEHRHINDIHHFGANQNKMQELLNKYPYAGEITTRFCQVHNQSEIYCDVIKQR